MSTLFIKKLSLKVGVFPSLIKEADATIFIKKPSLKVGVFPSLIKEAGVCLIHKKAVTESRCISKFN